jgi:uncharacterized protein YjiS (DUF1127 family)
MIHALTNENRSFDKPISVLKRLIVAVFQRPATIALNREELSDHLLRDIGILDGDRSDGRLS